MALSTILSENDIRELASDQSFERGQGYFEHGAVLSLARRGNRLHALVEGTQEDPYSVWVGLGAAGVVDAYCTCPYDWGGVCKHIVATLLAYIHEPGRIVERTLVESLLAPLSREQLRQLLFEAIDEYPDLIEHVEAMARRG